MQQHDRHVWKWRINSDKIWAERGYRWGKLEPNYPVPANIGRVSLGTDYAGLWFIDSANADDPQFVWAYDTWDRRQLIV